MYDPLDPTKREIRLVVLKAPRAETQSEFVECELVTVSLDENPTYSALSYVWGDQTDKTNIIINGNDFGVTQNLGAALSVLCKRQGCRLYWIDAICINQDDDDEKSQQVRIMLDIYRSAQMVLSWLGKADEHTEGAQAFIEAFPWDADDVFKESWMESVCKDDSADKKHMLQNLKHLSHCLGDDSREYWDRLWIVQELEAAPRGSVLIDDFEMQYIKWTIFLSILSHLGTERKLSVIHSDQFVHLILPGDRTLLKFRYISRFKSSRTKPPLLALLDQHGRKGTSKPQDRVFALVGISEMEHSSHDGLLIDYGRTPEEVFRGAARAIIETSRRLDILTRCDKTPSDLSVAIRLPSWVPAWYTEYLKPVSTARQKLHGTSFVHFRNGPGILSVRAVQIGKVLHFAAGKYPEKEPYTVKDSTRIVSGWAELAMRIDGDWASTARDLILTCAQGKTDFREPAELVLEHAMDDRALNPSHTQKREYLLYLIDLSRPKSFFLMQPHGDWARMMRTPIPRMGLGTPNLLVGDEIYVFLGCSSPMLIRRHKDYHTVIGPCYVDAIARGEALADIEAGSSLFEMIDLK